jgi:hypothetical protein
MPFGTGTLGTSAVLVLFTSLGCWLFDSVFVIKLKIN